MLDRLVAAELLGEAGAVADARATGAQVLDDGFAIDRVSDRLADFRIVDRAGAALACRVQGPLAAPHRFDVLDRQVRRGANVFGLFLANFPAPVQTARTPISRASRRARVMKY